jgi:hypothetical protein
VTFGLGNRCSIRLSYGTENDFNSLANRLGLLSLFYLLLIRAAIGGFDARSSVSASRTKCFRLL